MNDQRHPVDDFFKEALQQHRVKPSDAGRQRFLDEASSILKRRNRLRNRRWLFLSGFLTFTTAALLLWFTETEQPEQFHPGSPAPVTPTGQISPAGTPPASSTASSSPSPIRPTSAADSPTTPIAASKAFQTASQGPSNATITTPQTASAASSGATIASVTSGSRATSPVSANQPADAPPSTLHEPPVRISSPSPTLDSPESHTVPPARTSADPVETESPVSALATDVPLPDTAIREAPDTAIILQDTIAGDRKTKERRRNGPWKMAFPASYSPDWMFNTLEGTKFVNNFGIEGTIRNGKYLLRAGVGLTVTSGANEMLVEYNDYLGTYQSLDSITFHWDEKNYHLLPTYYLSQKDVWDSLLKLDYPTVQKRYTYIQIPVMLGYDLISGKTFSFGFRAGQILSLLVATRQLTPDYDPLKNRVVQINNITVDRIESNWQVLAGVNFTWHINRRISLEVEPLARYYFTSVYEKTDISKKVWSLGFRTAVTFNR